MYDCVWVWVNKYIEHPYILANWTICLSIQYYGYNSKDDGIQSISFLSVAAVVWFWLEG